MASAFTGSRSGDESLSFLSCLNLVQKETMRSLILYVVCTQYVPGPSEAVRHGGGRRTKNLQGERERKKKKKGKERREEKEKREEEKEKRERRA